MHKNKFVDNKKVNDNLLNVIVFWAYSLIVIR
jgi:hypothetical protein